jgi:hypothetical protein
MWPLLLLSAGCHPAGPEAAPAGALIACDGRNIPCDPVNLAVVASEAEIRSAMAAAGWYQADATGFRTGSAMAVCITLNRPYYHAPMSKLYLWGRAQDLAFELPEGNSPRRRHHVRFWKSDVTALDGRAVWVGAATFDNGLRMDRHSGKITHSIDPDLDAERDRLVANLARAGQWERCARIDGVGPTVNGLNASGDRYFTDGQIALGFVPPGNQPLAAPDGQAIDLAAGLVAVQLTDALGAVRPFGAARPALAGSSQYPVASK